MASRSAPRAVPGPTETEVRVRDLTERRDSIERRKAAARAEVDELRQAIEAAAVRGEDASAPAAEMAAAEARERALALEAGAIARALATASAERDAERLAERRDALERERLRTEEAFREAERRYRATLHALSESLGAVLSAHRAFDDASGAVKRVIPDFHPERADEDLLTELRTGGAEVDVVALEVPFVLRPGLKAA